MSDTKSAAATPATTVDKQYLAGWGNYPRLACQLLVPETVGELRNAVLEARPSEGRIPRGLGRSYGDPALSDRGAVVDCSHMDRILAFDSATGVLRCEAGVTLETILREFVPQGFMPMITPGTKFVTVGGCIANDVHGKAHHVDGCFSSCVASFRIMLADGQVVDASPTHNPEIFWASFGGLGLLGVILEATIRLRPVETAYFRQTAVKVPSLDALLDAIDEHAHLPYSVAWVDALATGAQLGRGVLTVGDHASVADLPAALQGEPLRVSEPSPLVLPFELPSAALNTATIRMLNVVLDQLQSRGKPIAHYEKFFYPLDFVGRWNRGYGPRGFTQYQFVIPMEDGRKNIRELLTTIAESGQSPFLNVLKRLGPERPETMLSFPMEGYTFAIDFPIRDGLPELLQGLDERILAMGGRIYLGKDAFLKRDVFERMYPRLAEWRAIKAKVDPESRFSSAMGRRLGLSE